MLYWFRTIAPLRLKMHVLMGTTLCLTTLPALVILTHILPPRLTTAIIIAAPLLMIPLMILAQSCIAIPYVTMTLTLTVEAMAAGDMTCQIPYASYQDCLGRIARALTTFRQISIDKLETEQEANRQAAARRALEAEAHEYNLQSEREQRDLLDILGMGLDSLAKGDLTCHFARPFHTRHAKLQQDFNSVVDHLHAVIQTVAENATLISASSTEITDAAEDLSKRALHQADHLAHTSTTIRGITDMVGKTADATLHANQLAQSTRKDIERSNALMASTSQAMRDAQHSSDQISRIIGLIDDIAFQTNLLALNASVEAARAGDSGRGFAVVATEVRALAQRSADAAKDVKSLVGTATSQVKKGSALVHDTGKALAASLAHIGALTTIISEIAHKAKDEAASLNEVEHAVTGMERDTQKNAVMVSQAAASSRHLTHETQSLVRRVNHFQLTKASRTAPATSHPVPA